jgi:hypothetical protein
MIFGGDMPKTDKYIVRKYGKYYISGSNNYGEINKSYIFTNNDVDNRSLTLDRDDELLRVEGDGKLTITDYPIRNLY